jgi:tricarboxylate carrier
MNSVPEFSIKGDLYDQTTYIGRFKHFASIIDPGLLFLGDSHLASARRLLEEFRTDPKRTKLEYNDEQLWEAKRIVDSAVNSATGETIHPIARMCAFIPSSVPITLGMLTMTSTPAVLGLQWINQSYNAIFNYSHRSEPSRDKTKILKAYALATATSCGLAFGLNKIASNIRPPWLISTVAVMAAGSANVAFTRANEIEDGVSVFNKDGEKIGTSKIAGKYAVGYTILSRSVLLPIPLMVVPGFLSSFLSKRFMGGRTSRVVDILCIVAAQAVTLPACVAAFPQKLSLKRSQLEPQFHSPEDEIVFVQKGV